MDKTINSTLIEAFERLFAAGKEEHFEDGVDSLFSRELKTYIEQYGNIAIKIVGDLLRTERVNPVVAGEALRWIGHSKHVDSHQQRRQLLEQNLTAASHYIRDGALLGLSFMDDPKAIPALKYAIEHEPINDLRQDMIDILEQLEQPSAETPTA